MYGVIFTLLAGMIGLGAAPAVHAVANGAVISAANGALAVPGGEVMLPINVGAVTDLGAVTVVVTYDPARLTPVKCERNPVFSIGLCNLRYDQDLDGTVDSVRFNSLATDGVNVGTDALLPLVGVTWHVTGTPSIGATTFLSLTVVTFTNSQGVPMAVAAQNGQVVFFSAATGTPTATATATASSTPSPTATATNTATPAPTPTPTTSATFTPTPSFTPTDTPTITPTVPIGGAASNFIYLPSVSRR